MSVLYECSNQLSGFFQGHIQVVIDQGVVKTRLVRELFLGFGYPAFDGFFRVRGTVDQSLTEFFNRGNLDEGGERSA